MVTSSSVSSTGRAFVLESARGAGVEAPARPPPFAVVDQVGLVDPQGLPVVEDSEDEVVGARRPARKGAPRSATAATAAAQRGLAPGEERTVLPICMHVTQPAFFYVRVHRRQGTQRVLGERGMEEGAARLRPSRLRTEGLRGPVHFLWGTDWEDQPMVNAATLAAKLAARPSLAASIIAVPVASQWPSIWKVSNPCVASRSAKEESKT